MTHNFVLLGVSTTQLVAVPGVKVSVEVEHSDRTVDVVERSENRQHNRVVSTQSQDAGMLPTILRKLCCVPVCVHDRTIDESSVSRLHLVDGQCGVIR